MASSFLGNSALPLGLRNNNPGNLRPLPGGQRWVGEIEPDKVNNFSRFSDVAYGLRAMITDIAGDIMKDGRDTLTKLITAYAPPNENNTQAYITAVANYTGIGPHEKITAARSTLEKIIKAKLRVELGASQASKISQKDIDQGFERLSGSVLEWVGSTIKKNPGTAILIVAAVIALVLTRK